VSLFGSLRSRLVVSFLAVTLVPLGLLAAWSLLDLGRRLERVQAEALSHQCTLAALEFEKAFYLADLDLLKLSELPELQALLETEAGAIDADERPGRLADLTTRLMRGIERRESYAGVAYIDAIGDEIARVRRDRGAVVPVPPEQLRNVVHEPFFSQSTRLLFSGDVWGGNFRPLDPAIPERGAVIRIVNPLFSIERTKTGTRMRRRGLLALDLDVDALLGHIRSRGVTAETLVLIDGRTAHIEHPRRPAEAGALPWRLDLAQRHPLAYAQLTTGSPTAGGAIATLKRVEFPSGRSSTDLSWAVATIRPLAAVRAPIRAAQRVWAVISVASLVIAVVLARSIARRLSEPITILAREATELGRGRFDRVLDVRTGDEIEELARAMNRMARELQDLYRGLEARIAEKTGALRDTNAELRQAYEDLKQAHEQLKASEAELVETEKLSSIGRLAASVAHEINNPAGIVSMYAQMLREDATDDQTRESLDLIVESADKVASTVKSLLDFSRRAPADPQPVELAMIVAAAVSELAMGHPERTTEVEVDVAERMTVLGDADQLQQVFRNLIDNACQAAGDDGRVEIHARAALDEVEIAVQDDGPGIPSEVLPRIFEPFFTTKPGAKGTGLGLAVAYGIVKSHRGAIRAESVDAGGARFTVMLPGVPISHSGASARF